MSKAVPVAVIIGILACSASGAIAREGFEITSPTKTSILSWETIFLKIFTASCVSPLLSASTISIFFPLIPPAALISLTFSLNPFTVATPYWATFPVSGAITPILITFESTFLDPQLITNNAIIDIKNNIFFIISPRNFY